MYPEIVARNHMNRGKQIGSYRRMEIGRNQIKIQTKIQRGESEKIQQQKHLLFG